MPHRRRTISNQFFKSAMSKQSAFLQNDQVMKWLQLQNEKVTVSVERIPFSEMRLWSFSEKKDHIVHHSGKYFTIEGIQVSTDWGSVHQWEQPIIHQPEIGFLGFLAKEFENCLHLLVQAKIEPGNVNHVQLSPTLQATKSNYTQVHKGSKPLFLDHFKKARPEHILLDQLQSEQGGRFLKKRNRNMIVEVVENIHVPDNFLWMTLGQIKNLMQYNNLVNMDTRTVISGIPFGTAQKGFTANLQTDSPAPGTIQEKLLHSRIIPDKALKSNEDIISFLTALKSTYELNIKRIPLSSIRDWSITDNEIAHIDQKYFSVIAVDVSIGNREVTRWSQPMVEPAQEGLCAFVCKEIGGRMHFAVQAKLECGNFDTIEFAPTVQCLTGNYRQAEGSSLPFLDYVLNAPRTKIIYDAMQSEEGGRFYREQNRNMIVMAGEEISTELPDKYIWMTLHQLSTFIKYNNYLNIQARSLIAAISFI